MFLLVISLVFCVLRCWFCIWWLGLLDVLVWDANLLISWFSLFALLVLVSVLCYLVWMCLLLFDLWLFKLLIVRLRFGVICLFCLCFYYWLCICVNGFVGCFLMLVGLIVVASLCCVLACCFWLRCCDNLVFFFI